MFGLLQPCRRRLGPDLYRAWTAHLCGTCLAAGKDFGQVARAATNVDGLLVSVLVAAQQTGGVDRQMAGRCPLRRLRRAEVVAPDAAAARYAAAVSLLLAGTKLADHVADGDLPRRVRPVRPVVRRVAAGWTAAGTASAAAAGLDTSAATALLERQSRVEAAAGPGDLLAVTAPTEEITAEVLATTATIADRPANREPLALVGRMFGRVAHLLDAVGDLESDRRRGAWNPLTATATDLPAARALVERAVDRLQGALDRVELTDPELARHLLGRELPHRAARVFAAAGAGAGAGAGEWGQPQQPGEPRAPKKERWYDYCDYCDCCNCCDCRCSDCGDCGDCCDCCGCDCCDCDC